MHYYKRNIGDYHKKAGRLSMLEHGAYTLLMDACYDREKFPSEEEAIDWLWASTDEEVAAVKFVLAKFFTLVDDVYVQSRIQDDLDKYHETAATNKRIAIEREAKRKEKSTKRGRSVNEAPPNHKPLTTNHKPLTKNQVNKADAFDFSSWPELPSDQVWSDFVKHRNSVKAKITQTVINRMAKNLSTMLQHGWSVDDVLATVCEKGWKSFEPDWLLRTNQPRQGQVFDMETPEQKAARILGNG